MPNKVIKKKKSVNKDSPIDKLIMLKCIEGFLYFFVKREWAFLLCVNRE